MGKAPDGSLTEAPRNDGIDLGYRAGASRPYDLPAEHQGRPSTSGLGILVVPIYGLFQVCGRFSVGIPATTLAAQIHFFETSTWMPRYNIAPTQEVLVIVKTPEDPDRKAKLKRWGLIPSWAKNHGIGNQLINAQAETAATKPAFRVAFRKRRCLILADGFYERKKEGRHKQPFHIRLQDGRPFAFAGLWEHWEGLEGKAIDACTILTATPNDLLRPLHHRMAVILPSSAYDRWFDLTIQEVEPLQPLLRPYPSEEMTAYPVSTRVNNPANDTPDCVKPLP